MSLPLQTEKRAGLSPVSKNNTAPDNGANTEGIRQMEPKASPQSPSRPGVIRIVSFFALIIVLIYATNAVINFGLRRIKTSQFGVSNKIVSGEINADIIITGSSRALSHYDPRIIQSITGRSAFNIGRNGSQTDMQLAVLKTYLKHNRKPSLVIHNLDSFSFVMTTEVYDPAQYIPYLDEKDIYDALHKIDPGVWWKCKYLPLYGYVAEDMRLDWMLAPLGIFGRSPSENFFLGFNPRPGTWSEDFVKFQGANPNGVDFKIEPAGVQVMEELIRTCKENGIKLIFVYSPEYREMQLLTRDRSEIFSEFQKLSQTYSVPFWDFSDWGLADNTNFFNNSQHLNEQGAETFSTDLAHRLAHELQSTKWN